RARKAPGRPAAARVRDRPVRQAHEMGASRRRRHRPCNRPSRPSASVRPNCLNRLVAALYRTYRPQTFSEVVGQEPVVRTLTNAIETGRVRQAYLFAGPRGTGKTSLARILAKGINCEHGPTAKPDNTCYSCVSISAGCAPDVFELVVVSQAVDDVG